MDWLRRLLGVKTDRQIHDEVLAEPTIKNARKALARASKWTGISDDILEDYAEAEAKRRPR